EQLALAHRVLCVRNAVSADTTTGEVGNRADVAGTPGIRNNAVIVHDAQIGLNAKAPTLFEGKVGALDDRVGHDARGPHDDVGLERFAGGQLDLAADRGGQLRVEVHLGAALGEVLEHPVARLERHLGHDAAHRLDEVEVSVVEGQRGVVAQERTREAAQLTEGLNAGESTADDGYGEEAIALGPGGQVRCAIEVGE